MLGAGSVKAVSSVPLVVVFVLAVVVCGLTLMFRGPFQAILYFFLTGFGTDSFIVPILYFFSILKLPVVKETRSKSSTINFAA